MRIFAQKPKATQQNTCATTTLPGRAPSGTSRDVNSIVHLQRTIGNQAVLMRLRANTEDAKKTEVVTAHSNGAQMIRGQANAGPSAESEANSIAKAAVTDAASSGGGESLRRSVERQTDVSLGGVRVDAHSSKPGSLGAQALTSGSEVHLDADSYHANTPAGRYLLAHEFAHAALHSGDGSTHLKSKNKFGGVRIEKGALQDLLKGSALVQGADQTHISIKGDQLGYDPSYSTPEDPFRWSKLKEIIDSGEKILIRKGSTGSNIPVRLMVRGKDTTTTIPLQLGETLLSDALLKGHGLPLDGFVSPDSKESHIWYSDLAQPAGTNSLAHELYGHFWLALQGLPYIHGAKDKIDPTKQKTTVLDPLGAQYTGTVDDFIAKFAAAKNFSQFQSGTMMISPTHYPNELKAFKKEFAASPGNVANTTAWKVSDAADLQFSFILESYDLATTVKSKASSAQAVDRAQIENDLTTFYAGLKPDLQAVFLRFLDAILGGLLSPTTLASVLRKKLKAPKGFVPDTQQAPSFGGQVSPHP